MSHEQLERDLTAAAAEIERLRLSADDANLSRIVAEEERELLRKNNLTNCLQIASLQEALSRAEAARDAAVKDAGRVNHLESYGNVVAGVGPDMKAENAKFGWTNNSLFTPPRTLREVIDGAMAASKDRRK